MVLHSKRVRKGQYRLFSNWIYFGKNKKAKSMGLIECKDRVESTVGEVNQILKSRMYITTQLELT